MATPPIATPVTVTFTALHRKLAIATGVVLLHALGLWAMQTGLLRRVIEMVEPAELLVEIVTAAPPQVPAAPAPKLANGTKTVSAPTAVTPMVNAIAQPMPNPPPQAQPVPAPVFESVSTAASTMQSNTATPASGPGKSMDPSSAVATGSAPQIEPPSSDADYLNNPRPQYPALSKRLREQGKVVVRTLIGADGVAQQAEIKHSSGFDRLDQAALATAIKWRYVPGKRAGVPESMWFNVPINFVLE